MNSTIRGTASLARTITTFGLAAAAATGLILAPAIADTAPSAEAKRVATVDNDTCSNGEWGVTPSGTGHMAFCYNYQAWETNSSTDIALSKDLRTSDKKWLRSTFTHSKGNENRRFLGEVGYVLDDPRNNWEAGDSCPSAKIRGKVVKKMDAISADGTFLRCRSDELATTRR